MAQALAGLQHGEYSGAGIDFRGRSLAPASLDFWLNTHEDASPGKAEQYERWRRLRETRKAAEH
jgi:hypothetical protein